MTDYPAAAIDSQLGAVSYEHDKLRRLASAATPGPWESVDGDVWTPAECSFALEGINDQRGANAAFIASANPATVIALLDRIAELERELQAVHVLDAWATKNRYNVPQVQNDLRDSGCWSLFAFTERLGMRERFVGSTPARARIAAAEALAQEDPGLLETELPATLPR